MYQSVDDDIQDDPSQRGLYPSQITLIRLVDNWGIQRKESKAGRMSEDVLNGVVGEVKRVESVNIHCQYLEWKVKLLMILQFIVMKTKKSSCWRWE